MNTSTRTPFPAACRYLGPAAPDTPITVTLVFRHRAPPAPAGTRGAAMSREAFAQAHGADPAALTRVRALAGRHGLEEVDCQPQRRILRLRGSAQQIGTMFGVSPAHYAMGDSDQRVLGVAQAPNLPDPSVIAVLGLDQRPVAKPHFRPLLTTGTASFTPPELGALYGFPAGTDGGGQTIAIIELGGGYREDDLSSYFASLGIAGPTVTPIAVDGAGNAPGGAADGEVALDIEVAGALAPAARLAVYFAPNTDAGFFDAISQAAHDTGQQPSVISISWGGPEDNWSAASREAMESALQDAVAMGVTVTVAAGDDGATDGQSDGQLHVDYPAASPCVLACGGTRLIASAGTIGSETVWNESASGNGATGGGVSRIFARPAWQAGMNVPATPDGFQGRGVPDVAGVADPLTGYRIRLDGQDLVYGGTSAVAPLWAALVARLNQSLGHDLGDGHASLYPLDGQGFHDITQGDNGHYRAGKGWDACTGLGSPDGTALRSALAG
ncbi:S53 family peptidase [Dyella sp. KRB-257]|uniref:S53 family peptidase n=1 Tax=Dyella sp. KRB-257 TaxID=3400915 RepID=UPI003C01149A